MPPAASQRNGFKHQHPKETTMVLPAAFENEFLGRCKGKNHDQHLSRQEDVRDIKNSLRIQCPL